MALPGFGGNATIEARVPEAPDRAHQTQRPRGRCFGQVSLTAFRPIRGIAVAPTTRIPLGLCVRSENMLLLHLWQQPHFRTNDLRDHRRQPLSTTPSRNGSPSHLPKAIWISPQFLFRCEAQEFFFQLAHHEDVSKCWPPVTFRAHTRSIIKQLLARPLMGYCLPGLPAPSLDLRLAFSSKFTVDITCIEKCVHPAVN